MVMRIIRDFSACPSASKGAVVALGNFDGVHLGHQAILRECIDTARKLGAPAAVMSFEPHPREFFAPGSDPLSIYPFRRKVELLRELGIDTLFLVRFNERFASLTAEAFTRDILHAQLGVRHVVTGYNFAFGKGRGGNTEFLHNAAKECGFGFSACPPVEDADGVPVSSSAIRRRLALGHVEIAGQLLGRAYAIEGRVRHGEQLGRKLGYPTANMALDDLFKPRFGIYAARARVDGALHDAVVSLGIRPTFGQNEPLLEVHIFAMDRELYGKRLHVELAGFLRDEVKFDTAQALTAQIALDCQQAKDILNHG
jgi:riboflavin kinase/FMN adenylyltransferase